MTTSTPLWRRGKTRPFALLCLVIAAGLLVLPAFAQTAALRGVVADESGAVIPDATVTLAGTAGFSKSASTAADGSYSFAGLPPGGYTVRAGAPGLTMRAPEKVALARGIHTLNLVLYVAAEKQQVTVKESGGPTVGTEAANNASAVVLRGTDLDALSDNPDDLAADLQALAGPAAGPNGGSIYIDGFSGGDLPPKDAIREIRINQNPFSPEYDKLGYGRVEIFTKPGTDKFHGSIGYNFANDVWNSRNAYAAKKAPFHLNEIRTAFSGPAGKRASFNLILIREWVDNGNAVNGVTLDPVTLQPVAFTDTPVAQLRRTGVTPRVDYQIASNHTLTLRYAYNRDIVRNAGTGGFNLASQGYHYSAPSQTVQLTETAVLGSSTVNELRFQYFRPELVSLANTPGDAIQVLGAFNGGGNPVGLSTDTQNTWELQNYTSVARGAHVWKFGVRWRDASETNRSGQNFAGTFTFSGALAPQLDAGNEPVLDGAGQPVLVNITSIEAYRRTLLFEQAGLSAAEIRQRGGGASQFSLSAGSPLVAGSQADFGLFAGDEWKLRPNVTVSLGLRYETQTNIHDRRDWAPRIGLAWAPGGTGRTRPRSVIRAGFGIFYDRFSLANILTARRYNGLVEQQYVIANPDFFPQVPPVSGLPAGTPSSTIQDVSSTLRAPYLMQSAAAFERQLPRSTTVAVTYANSHGLHMLRSEALNAPLPESGAFPLGRPGAVMLMESSGLYNQNQLIVNVNTNVCRDVSLNASYMYNRAFSNTDGLATFPANPYSMAGEYGPSATDMHHRIFLGGTISTILGIRLNPLLTANTGPPFDLTTGRDLYGDTLFNARPGIAVSSGRPGLIATRYGLLDPEPVPGERLVPRNFGRGPGQIMLNLRIGRTFAFGAPRERGAAAVSAPGGGGGPRGAPASPFSTGGGAAAAPAIDRRYSLTISVHIRNIGNHNNPGAIIGDITSPLFGQANQPAGSGNGVFSESANNRLLELQTRFTF